MTNINDLPLGINQTNGVNSKCYTNATASDSIQDGQGVELTFESVCKELELQDFSHLGDLGKLGYEYSYIIEGNTCILTISETGNANGKNKKVIYLHDCIKEFLAAVTNQSNDSNVITDNTELNAIASQVKESFESNANLKALPDYRQKAFWIYVGIDTQNLLLRYGNNANADSASFKAELEAYYKERLQAQINGDKLEKELLEAGNDVIMQYVPSFNDQVSNLSQEEQNKYLESIDAKRYKLMYQNGDLTTKSIEEFKAELQAYCEALLGNSAGEVEPEAEARVSKTAATPASNGLSTSACDSSQSRYGLQFHEGEIIQMPYTTDGLINQYGFTRDLIVALRDANLLKEDLNQISWADGYGADNYSERGWKLTYGVTSFKNFPMTEDEFLHTFYGTNADKYPENIEKCHNLLNDMVSKGILKLQADGTYGVVRFTDSAEFPKEPVSGAAMTKDVLLNYYMIREDKLEELVADGTFIITSDGKYKLNDTALFINFPMYCGLTRQFNGNIEAPEVVGNMTGLDPAIGNIAEYFECVGQSELYHEINGAQCTLFKLKDDTPREVIEYIFRAMSSGMYVGKPAFCKESYYYNPPYSQLVSSADIDIYDGYNAAFHEQHYGVHPCSFEEMETEPRVALYTNWINFINYPENFGNGAVDPAEYSLMHRNDSTLMLTQNSVDLLRSQPKYLVDTDPTHTVGSYYGANYSQIMEIFINDYLIDCNDGTYIYNMAKIKNDFPEAYREMLWACNCAVKNYVENLPELYCPIDGQMHRYSTDGEYAAMSQDVYGAVFRAIAQKINGNSPASVDIALNASLDPVEPKFYSADGNRQFTLYNGIIYVTNKVDGSETRITADSTGSGKNTPEAVIKFIEYVINNGGLDPVKQNSTNDRGSGRNWKENYLSQGTASTEYLEVGALNKLLTFITNSGGKVLIEGDNLKIEYNGQTTIMYQYNLNGILNGGGWNTKSFDVALKDMGTIITETSLLKYNKSVDDVLDLSSLIKEYFGEGGGRELLGGRISEPNVTDNTMLMGQHLLRYFSSLVSNPNLLIDGTAGSGYGNNNTPKGGSYAPKSNSNTGNIKTRKSGYGQSLQDYSTSDLQNEVFWRTVAEKVKAAYDAALAEMNTSSEYTNRYDSFIIAYSRNLIPVLQWMKANSTQS